METFQAYSFLNIWKKVPRSFKQAAACAFVLGFIVHIYSFTNLLLNHDAIFSLYTDNDTTTSGRWALALFSKFSTSFQLPVVIGLISLCALALAAGFAVQVLEMDHPVSAFLTAAFMVTSPVVAATFGYMFTADAYFIAVFLTALGAYLAIRFRWMWIPAIFLLATACGIYQAYLGIAVGLFLFDCLRDALRGEKTVREILIKGLKYILTAVLALIVYYIILRVVLKVRGLTLSAYQGLNDMSPGNLILYLKQIPQAYAAFFRYIWHTPYMTPKYLWVQRCFILVAAAALCYLIAAGRLYRKPIHLCLVLLGVAMMPLAMNVTAIMSPGANVHMLMVYPFLFLFVFQVKVLEAAARAMAASGIARRWLCQLPALAALAFSCVLIWSNIFTSNIFYLRLQILYENTYATTNRIMMHVESLPDYNTELPVIIVGDLQQQYAYGNRARRYFYETYRFPGSELALLNGTERFLPEYIGAPLPWPTAEQRKRVMESPIVAEMPCYPEAGFARIVDGVIVVKLSEP